MKWAHVARYVEIRSESDQKPVMMDQMMELDVGLDVWQVQLSISIVQIMMAVQQPVLSVETDNLIQVNNVTIQMC